MAFTTLEIILMAAMAIAAAVIVAGMLARRRFASKTARRMDSLYTSQIRDYESEIRRLNTLLDDESRRQKDAPQPSSSKSAAIAQAVDIEKIAAEQKSLEGQQQELSERNQVLWDMSVAIEKERQHIQTLKDEIENHHRAVTASIEYAKLIQNAVLPTSEILRESFADVFLFWRPRDIVSGDYYWMKQSGDIVAFTVADCTGHGVPGSFMSLLGITFLNDICTNLNADTQPSDVLDSLRNFLVAALSQDSDGDEPQDGMDMAFCILNLKTKKLRFSGGNNPMYLIRNGELSEFKPVKNPVGYFPRPKSFETAEFQAESGDWIYMFSDGFADQFHGKTKRKVTYGRFKELLVSVSSLPGKEQSEKLDRFLLDWRGKYVQLDDVMVGGYRVS